MAWTKVKRMRVTSDEPSVTLRPERISFNAVFIKLAELDKYSFVRIYFDEDERRVGFEFLKDQEDTDVFRLLKVGKYGYSCASQDILTKNWVRKVAQSPTVSVCPAKKDGKIWAITLAPSFEYSVGKEEINKVSSEISGIYRYINKDSEIVYIGKGNIKSRFKEKNRDTWIFERVEYSIIEDDAKSYEWETFWLEQFKDNNNGELPRYNLISGKTIE